MVKHRIDIEAGRQLRKIGWSHADIALYIGCSEDWCRHNLSDTKKDFESMKDCAECYFESKKIEVELDEDGNV